MKTPTSAKALREERAKLVADARKILDKAEAEKRDPTAEERQQWDAIMGGVDKDGKRVVGKEEELRLKIERYEQLERTEDHLAKPAGDPTVGKDPITKPGEGDGPVTDEDRALALQGWCRRQMGKELKKRHKEACRKVGINPKRPQLDIELRKDYRQARREYRQAASYMAYEQGLETRAQSININTAGGFTIPQGFVPSLEIALLAYWQPRQYVDVLRTDSGQDLPWPTVNDTANKGALLAENTQVTEVDVAFGQTILHAFKYTTKLILVSAELLEDSAFNLAQTLGDLMGIRLGRIQADHFTFGTGVGQPLGIVTASTVGVTTASPSAIAADEIYNLKHSVDPAYRPGAAFMMHDQVLLAVKKLKDGIGRYLWQAGLAGGAPDTLDGDPIVINQSMASSITNNALTMLYGALKKYKLRDVNQFRMRRLVERYADFDQEGFVGFARFDGQLLDAGTHPVKVMQQHS